MSPPSSIPGATPPSVGGQAPSTGASEAARAAQRAFFQAALGRTQATAAPAPTPLRAETINVRTTAPAPSPEPAQPGDRILRPGSLLDIKV